MMAITIEAIYQSGVLKPLTPLPDIRENQKVRLIVEHISLIETQRKHRIQLPPDISRSIGDSPGYEMWEDSDAVD